MKNMGWRNENMDCVGPSVPLKLRWSSSCYLANNIFKLFLFYFFFPFLKTTGLPPRGFHPSFLLWVPQKRFSPRDIFSFFLFFSTPLGHLKRFSTQHRGLGASWGFSDVFLFVCLFLGTWWGRSWDLLHHYQLFTDSIDEFLFWQGLLVDLQFVPIEK